MSFKVAGSSSKSKEKTVRLMKPAGHVGFDTLPDQMVNKSIKNGFVFNVMCIGETGLGKSTLMDTLFNTSFSSKVSSHNLPQVKLKANTYILQENNVRLKLTICETVGYGDQIDKQNSFQAVVDYIDLQFETYLQEELKIKRSLVDCHDRRIHACLYFISPTGHGLKSLDLLCMKQLDSKVNIIPIIAKADTISKLELKRFKEKVMAELQSSKIQIYESPTNDETVADANAAVNEHTPFAVVASTDFVKIGNKELRVRQYPWGTVQVENEIHCDFIKLREMLIRTNMDDLCEQTHIRHYELYRQKRLQEMGCCDVDIENKPVSLQKTFELKRSNHVSELLANEEEVNQLFVQRVRIKESELIETERKLHLRFDKLRRYYAEEQRKLDEVRRKLEKEYKEFTILKNQYSASHKTMTLGKNRKK